MKKPIITLLSLVVITLSLWAANDKFHILNSDGSTTKLWLEDIESITVANDGSASDGFTHLRVNQTDGTTKELTISQMGAMDFKPALPASQIDFTVEPHHMCATFHVTSPEPNVYWSRGAMPLDSLQGLDPREWGEACAAYDIKFYEAKAAEMGYPIWAYSTEDVFYGPGDLKIDWFPDTQIEEIKMPGRDYVAYVYAGHIGAEGIVVDSEVVTKQFKAKEMVDIGVRFDVTADLKSNAITVKADPIGGSDITYNIDLFRDWQIEQSGLQQLVTQSLTNLEQLVYRFGYTWDEVLYRGHGEKHFYNYKTGEVVYAVVYGVEYGVTTTDASYGVFEIPLPEIVDDCTFEVTCAQQSVAVNEITVNPSNPATRYVATIKEHDYFTDGMTHEQFISNTLYFKTLTNTIVWDNPNDPLIHQGTAVLNSHDDLIDGKYLNVGIDYDLLIWGVDDKGERTTAVKTVEITPTSDNNRDMRFEVNFSNFDDTYSWTHYLNLKVTPSDSEKKYVCNHLPISTRENWLDLSDDDFITNYVQVSGTSLKLNTGSLETKIGFTSWGTWEDYILFVFGYDGEPTSPLYLYRINSETGEITPLRTPED